MTYPAYLTSREFRLWILLTSGMMTTPTINTITGILFTTAVVKMVRIYTCPIVASMTNIRVEQSATAKEEGKLMCLPVLPVEPE
jgi:hypothetical protein